MHRRTFLTALGATGVGALAGSRPIAAQSVSPYDHAHNARIDEDLYAQRSMTETVNSAVKRSLGYAVRARDWYREFREITLMCAVYNIKRSVAQ